MKPYKTKRGIMLYFVRCWYANDYVTDIQICEQCIENYGTSSSAAHQHIREHLSLNNNYLYMAQIHDQTGCLGSFTAKEN